MTPKRLVIRITDDTARLMVYKLVSRGREALHATATCGRGDLRAYLAAEPNQDLLGLREADKRIAERSRTNLPQ